ncbi:MAG: uncharacterized protein AEth_00085 [Candidatus Argoarchaeum ethanivorans]|uniref:Phosphomevalonate dehydratase small subunit n=1 Tax=Candidatus Argoarchaeum ethanivorans TaxID=2608793 RepID=A0A8B3S7C8_9EURY|nr:MAG: uncharacterized protein AEth_00085 [Candidatus Argoarchaeum ethanivorans]
MKIKAHRISKGKASGRILLTKDAISFLGSVDPKTGIVVEKEHELEGESISEKILLFPCGKGSTVGSYVIYQLKKNNVAPAAMINLRCEPIVAVGAIMSGIPLVDQPEKNPFEILRNGDSVLVDADNEYIEIS